MSAADRSELPVDSDLTVTDDRGQGLTVVVIAAGGALGAAARFGVGRAFPTARQAFPWSTLAINVLGCLLLGALLVAVVEGRLGHRLARPFLGVGVLGGFTTFSTYTVDTVRLGLGGAVEASGLYLLGTVAAAVLAAEAGILGARWLLRNRR